MIQGSLLTGLTTRVNTAFRTVLSSTNHLCLYLSSFFNISDLHLHPLLLLLSLLQLTDYHIVIVPILHQFMAIDHRGYGLAV
jgi:hypothetical protein